MSKKEVNDSYIYHGQQNGRSPQTIQGQLIMVRGNYYGLQLQFWPSQELVDVIVAAPSEMSRELTNSHSQLQLHFLIPPE